MNTHPNESRGPGLLLMLAAAAGAAAMYTLDPQQGRRRRALGRDQALHLQRHGRKRLATALRDLRHRLRGWAARVHSRRRARLADDQVVAERVRAALGRVASHPHALQVHAAAGRVLLKGPALASEEARIVAAAQAVPGVKAVERRVDWHAAARGLSASQDGQARRGPLDGFRPTPWAPGPRLLALAAGVSLALCGLAARRHRVIGWTLAGTGAALATSAITNAEPGLPARGAQDPRNGSASNPARPAPAPGTLPR